jgi:hemolysin III
MREQVRLLSSSEERINFITHFIGFLLSCVGVILLITFALWEVEGSRLLSRLVYGTTLITMYVASSFYHRVLCQKKKEWLRK